MMAEKEENKFIVVKTKDFEELKEKIVSEFVTQHPHRQKGQAAKLLAFEEILATLDNGNKYVVINQDEPYADAVWDIIIAFENLKEKVTD